MTPVEVPCKKCGEPVTILPIGGITEGYCDACTEAVSDHSSEAHGLANTRLRWLKLMENFKFYLQSDFYKLPCPEASGQALAWEFGSTGLNLWGPPSLGKTRTLCMVLEKLHFDGKRFYAFGPSDLSLAIQKCGWNTGPYLNKLRCCDVLAFDDLGKIKLSPVMEGHFFGLLEYFCASGKPLMVTHNYDKDTLPGRFIHGQAILARLADPERFQSIEFKA